MLWPVLIPTTCPESSWLYPPHEHPVPFPGVKRIDEMIIRHLLIKSYNVGSVLQGLLVNRLCQPILLCFRSQGPASEPHVQSSFDWGSKIVLKIYLPTGSSGKKEVHKCWNTLAIRSGLYIVILLTLFLLTAVTHLSNVVCPRYIIYYLIIRIYRQNQNIQISVHLLFRSTTTNSTPFSFQYESELFIFSLFFKLSAWKTSRLFK